MQYEDFENLTSINRMLRDIHEAQDLDLCQIVVQSLDQNLSVTARHCPPSEYVTLDENLKPKPVEGGTGYYYGVSPLLDAAECEAIISNGILDSETSLKNYISQHHNWFCVHASQKEVLLPFAMQIIVAMARTFETNQEHFYNGVLLRPKCFSEIKPATGNADIQTLSIDFERTTFATIVALDNDFSNEPVLHGAKDVINALRYHDLALKHELRDRLKADKLTNEEAIKVVNEYLSQSWNVNQLSISANIVTNDGYVLQGIRGANTIDQGALYAGVNGNAELADAQVSFYKESVFEDYPTISLDTGHLDFLGEIKREALAELGYDFSQKLWKCSGVAVIGNTSRASTQQRCQFNMLFECESDLNFMEHDKLFEHATEKYEIKTLKGVTFETAKNGQELIKKTGGRGVRWLDRYWDTISNFTTLTLALSALFAALYARGTTKQVGFEQVTNSVVGALSVVLAMAALAKFLKKENRDSRQNKRANTLVCYLDASKPYSHLLEQLSESLVAKGKNVKIHGSASATLVLHAVKSMRDALRVES